MHRLSKVLTLAALALVAVSPPLFGQTAEPATRADALERAR
jgi:hypothetical protein